MYTQEVALRPFECHQVTEWYRKCMVTLNDLEQCNGRYFTEFGSFGGQLSHSGWS